MGEMNKGIISEEALDEVAAGAGVSKEKLVKGLKIAGVSIAGVLGIGAGLTYLGKKAYDKKHLVFGLENKPKDYKDPDDIKPEDVTVESLFGK